MHFFRATVEANRNLSSEKLPPVTVTVASNDVDFIIKYAFVFLLWAYALYCKNTVSHLCIHHFMFHSIIVW